MNKLYFLFFITLVSCTSSNTGKERNKSLPLTHLEENIDSLFHAKISKDGPGATVLVSYEGEKLISKSFGLADLKTKIPMSPATNLRTGSIGKQFTTLAILSLVDQGLLALDDPIQKFWPSPVFQDVNVQNLINHTSGLADYAPYFKENWDRDHIVENKDILDWLATNPTPVFKAGSKFQYCNTGYILLALLVEKVSGETFPSFVKRQIFEKVEMDNTTFYSFAQPVEITNRAFCYQKDSLGDWEKVDGNFMDGVMGGGGMYTSINDYYKYDLALQNKTIVSGNMHELIFKPGSPPLPGQESYQFSFLQGLEQYYGMGWFLTDKIALHGGSWNGARAMVVKHLKDPLTIAIFMNSGSTEIRNELTEATYSIVKNYITNKSK